MNVAHAACASSNGAPQWNQIDWADCERDVRRLQARIVKATRCLTVLTGSVRAGLCSGLSRMKICSQFCYVA